MAGVAAVVAALKAYTLILDGAMLQVPLSSRRTVSRRTLMSNGLPTTGTGTVLRNS
jgi:hypothetical protein